MDVSENNTRGTGEIPSHDQAATTTNVDGRSSTAPVVVLGTFWDEWSRCISSRYQRDQLYRVGRLDGCSRQWNDLKIAGRAKVVQYRNPQEANELVASTYYKKRTTISPTAGAIWELKEQPGWD